VPPLLEDQQEVPGRVRQLRVRLPSQGGDPRAKAVGHQIQAGPTRQIGQVNILFEIDTFPNLWTMFLHVRSIE
jgi:hypothetical protein